MSSEKAFLIDIHLDVQCSKLCSTVKKTNVMHIKPQANIYFLVPAVFSYGTCHLFTWMFRLDL